MDGNTTERYPMTDNIIDFQGIIKPDTINDQMGFSIDKDSIHDMVEEATRVAEENEDIKLLRDIQDTENEETELVEAKASFPIGFDGKPNYTREVNDELKETNLSLDEAVDGALDKENVTSFMESFKQNAKDTYDLSDDDAAALLDVILAYKKDKTINVYNRLPEVIKAKIVQLCVQNNLPATERNNIAKSMMTEFIAEAETDQTFIDFESALDNAMKIPSLTDLYNEHLNETMDTRLPAMADAIESEDPEKAKMLRVIAERFTWSIEYTEVRRLYLENSRIRKAIRRDYSKAHRFCEEINYFNRDTSFKMPDATLMKDILNKVLITEDPDSDITSTEIDKFITLICKSIEGLDFKEVTDASYIYYLLKNITMLSYANIEARESFSSELISNIKVTILMIRAKESENNANNSSTTHKQKRSRRK